MKSYSKLQTAKKEELVFTRDEPLKWTSNTKCSVSISVCIHVAVDRLSKLLYTYLYIYNINFRRLDMRGRRRAWTVLDGEEGGRNYVLFINLYNKIIF